MRPAAGHPSVLLALLLLPPLARAEEPAAAAPAPPVEATRPAAPPAAGPPAPGPGEEPPPPGATPAAPAAEAAPSQKGFALLGGWGYYETLHAGLSWHIDDRAALALFGGGGLAGGATTAEVGLGFWHALGGPALGLEKGWDLKALYWTRSDSSYDWQILSMVFGGYVSKQIDPRLTFRLDAGVALNATLASDRKQNTEFGSPTRWNASICLDVLYRLGAR